MHSDWNSAGAANDIARGPFCRQISAPVAARSFGSRKAQRGFIISAEAMLFVTILVLGTIGGWVAIRDAANAELVDVANALRTNVPYFSDPNRGSTESAPAKYFLEPCLLQDGETISEGLYQCAPID